MLLHYDELEHKAFMRYAWNINNLPSFIRKALYTGHCHNAYFDNR